MSKPETNAIQYKHIQSQEWEGSMDDMARILGATNPPAVDDAGKAYKDAANKFNASVDVLRKQAAALASVWKGKDADEAQKQMQRLHASARELGYRSGQTGVALTDHAEKLQWYKDHAPKEGFMKGVDIGDVASFRFGGAIGVVAKRAFFGSQEDKAAQEHMNRLQGRTVEANGYMPEDITTDLPTPGGTEWNRPPGGMPPGGHPPGGMPGGGMPGGGMPGGGGGGNLPKDPFGHGGGGGGGNLPHDPFGNGGAGGGGSHLPKDPFGGGGGGGGTNLAGMPHGPGGGGGGGLGGDPFGKGGLGGGAGGGLGGGPGGLSGGPPGGMPGGLGGGAPGAGAGRGMGGRGAGGMGGPPMGGGAGGGGKGGEEEHERSTWLTEDEDVWGGNDGDTAPPVIG